MLDDVVVSNHGVVGAVTRGLLRSRSGNGVHGKRRDHHITAIQSFHADRSVDTFVWFGRDICENLAYSC